MARHCITSTAAHITDHVVCSDGDLDKCAYTICTNEKLLSICILSHALLCKQSSFTTHCKDIDFFCSSIAKTFCINCNLMSNVVKSLPYRRVAYRQKLM